MILYIILFIIILVIIIWGGVTQWRFINKKGFVGKNLKVPEPGRPGSAPRHRIVRIKDIVVITNYKCGFSSINRLDVDELNPKDKNKYQKIMMYRNTNNRIISCFLNWADRFPKNDKLTQDGSKIGFLMEILKQTDGFNYDLFNKYLLEESDNNLIKAFKMFLEILPKIYSKNGHLHKQTKILSDNNISKIDKYINLDNPKDMSELYNILKQTPPVINPSPNNKKQVLLKFLDGNKKYNNILKNLYKEDDKMIRNI